MFTLWSIMFGDDLFNVWHDIDQINYFFAQIYVYTFMGFTITAVLKIFIVIIQDGYAMQKYFSRADWVKGVNQRTALHLVKHGDFNHQQMSSQQNNQESKAPVRSASEDQRSVSSSQIPKLYGVPLPSEGDPFVRLIKKSSKDVKSRIALLKLLKYEKHGVPRDDKSIRATETEKEETFELAAHFGFKSNEPSNQSLKDNVINETTPEGIANHIIQLLEDFKTIKQNEINKVEEGIGKNEEQEDIIIRYKHNMSRILKTLDKYKQIEHR